MSSATSGIGTFIGGAAYDPAQVQPAGPSPLLIVGGIAALLIVALLVSRRRGGG